MDRKKPLAELSSARGQVICLNWLGVRVGEGRRKDRNQRINNMTNKCGVEEKHLVHPSVATKQSSATFSASINSTGVKHRYLVANEIQMSEL